MPEIATCKHVKTSDTIASTARPATKLRALYTSVISQVTLQTLHEVFESDRTNKVDVVVFNSHLIRWTRRPGAGDELPRYSTNHKELSPAELESLITNLFEKMGLETRMSPSRTRPVRYLSSASSAQDFDAPPRLPASLPRPSGPAARVIPPPLGKWQDDQLVDHHARVPDAEGHVPEATADGLASTLIMWLPPSCCLPSSVYVGEDQVDRLYCQRRGGAG